MTEVPFLAGYAPAAPVLRDDRSEQWLTAGMLADQARAWRDRLGATPAKRLCFLVMGNECRAVAALLGALAAGRCVALLSPRLPAPAFAALLDAYVPDEIISAAGDYPGYGRDGALDGLDLWRAAAPAGPAPHPDVALLLSTSGSTGSPKFVRLRLESLRHNAAAIAECLEIGGREVACGHLPLDYSYGLSVLTSHLAAGARVALTGLSMMDRGFWSTMRAAGVTHLPGVPFHYQMMARLRFERLDLPDLATMTQAGGRMDLSLQEQAHAFMAARGGRFHVMYGQTEAAPRMTTLRHRDFAARKGSVGTVLRGGRIEIVDGEVVYGGPNVMMGYARCRADLAVPDQLGGVLHTGDRGTLDADGFLTLSGRLDRVVKLAGWRIDLDELEAAARAVLDVPVALVAHGDAIVVVAETEAPIDAAPLAARVALPPHLFRVRPVARLPRTANGKPDYHRLTQETP